MNVFEYAMQMELDGKTYYEEHAAKIESPQLKRILLELADDEQKHYNIFKAMRDGTSVEYEEAKKSTILAQVKNVFEELKAAEKDYSFPEKLREIWVKAREVESKAENFYREKANELNDENQKHIFNRIADEEHRHWMTMENVIRFLDRPSQWLEDAEWSNLEDY
ncbi:MAG: ferritin family protein [candidate division Zixibacteria bacterium]|nr:ferritin family protein [candidate division Zixibacteria bacterium]